jgi:hypothetical protein
MAEKPDSVGSEGVKAILLCRNRRFKVLAIILDI